MLKNKQKYILRFRLFRRNVISLRCLILKRSIHTKLDKHNMRSIKHYIAAIIWASVFMPVCAKTNSTFRSHLLFPESDYYIYKIENVEVKRGHPSIFNLYCYDPEDSLYFHYKVSASINNGIRDECLYVRDRQIGKEGVSMGYESTMEKVHKCFYKKIKCGYQNCHDVMAEKRLYGKDTLRVLVPEARVAYRELAKTLRNTLKAEEIQNLRSKQIPVVFMNCDIDEKGRVIYWYLASAGPLQGVISDETFRKIAAIMRKVRFPQTAGLKKKFRYGDGTDMVIYNDKGDYKWNDAMFGTE